MTFFMTVNQAAHRLSLSTRTVYDWLRTGKLPASRLGRQWRIDIAAIDALLSNSTTEED